MSSLDSSVFLELHHFPFSYYDELPNASSPENSADKTLTFSNSCALILKKYIAKEYYLK